MSERWSSAKTAQESRPRCGGSLSLALCMIGIVVIWGWVLPAIGSLAGVRAAIQRTEAQGIDAGAIFYTDVFHSLELRRANQLVVQR